MTIKRQQELRDLVNAFNDNESDETVFKNPLTTIEFAFCVMFQNNTEPDLLNDFCEDYIDTFSQ